MIGDSKEVLLAKIGTLEHIKAFVEINLKVRKRELKEVKRK